MAETKSIGGVIWVRGVALLSCLIISSSHAAEDKNPVRIVEGELMPLSAAAKKTLEILRKEKIEAIEFNPLEIGEGFLKLKERIEQLGIPVRYTASLNHRRCPKESSLNLVNISVLDCMSHFDNWAWWGWIVHEDGSITYFDSQCACGHPKNGLEYHAGSYEAGKPEAITKRNEDPRFRAAAEGMVPDEKTAIAIATAVLTARYGEDHVDKEGPYTASLKEGIWNLYGSRQPETSLKPLTLAKIRKSSGVILELTSDS